MDFITQNQEFVLGILSLLIIWIVSRLSGRLLDRMKINAALAMILDIIQDIKHNPETRELDNYRKKQLAVELATKSLPSKQTGVILKTFGTVGGAIEYVFHNRKWLFSLGKVVKGVF